MGLVIFIAFATDCSCGKIADNPPSGNNSGNGSSGGSSDGGDGSGGDGSGGSGNGGDGSTPTIVINGISDTRNVSVRGNAIQIMGDFFNNPSTEVDLDDGFDHMFSTGGARAYVHAFDLEITRGGYW